MVDVAVAVAVAVVVDVAVAVVVAVVVAVAVVVDVDVVVAVYPRLSWPIDDDNTPSSQPTNTHPRHNLLTHTLITTY